MEKSAYESVLLFVPIWTPAGQSPLRRDTLVTGGSSRASVDKASFFATLPGSNGSIFGFKWLYGIS
jgi:hypothetical protein